MSNTISYSFDIFWKFRLLKAGPILYGNNRVAFVRLSINLVHANICYTIIKTRDHQRRLFCEYLCSWYTPLPPHRRKV